MTVLLTLPAYNEEKGLPTLLRAFEQEMVAAGYASRVVIVDDGSTDGPSSVVQVWPSKVTVELVRHPVNRGLGATIRDGLRLAAEWAQPDDVIVTMDADNTHSPALIPAMIQQLEAGQDVVIASRYRSGAKVVGLSPFRHLTSYGARALFQLVLPIRGVRDYTCGFRAYRAALLQRAFTYGGGDFITENSFACMAEILLKLRRMGARMCEVPMVLRYDRKRGASNMRVGPTSWRTLRLVLRTRLSQRVGSSVG